MQMTNAIGICGASNFPGDSREYAGKRFLPFVGLRSSLDSTNRAEGMKKYMEKTTTYTIAGVLVAAALLAGGYAWFARPSPSQTAGPLEQLTIATITGYAASCPIFVGAGERLFPQ